MEKLYSHKQMKAEAQAEGFNKMKFAMEMEAVWWGETESAFFNLRLTLIESLVKHSILKKF